MYHGRILIFFCLFPSPHISLDRVDWFHKYPSCASNRSELLLAVAQPEDGSRLWIDSNAVVFRTFPTYGFTNWTDDENRLLLGVEINVKQWPEGAIVQLFVNSVQVGTIRTFEQTLPFTAFDEGQFTVSAALVLGVDQYTILSCSNATFVSSRHLEQFFDSEIHLAAEEPWDDSFINPYMDDIAYWQQVPEDFHQAEERHSEWHFLLSRWKNASIASFTSDRMMAIDESHASYLSLSQYISEHARVMSDPELAARASFLIFRPVPTSGLGNHLLALVSSFALALAAGRVLLVDSATLHHLLLPPRGLIWHYSRLVGLSRAGEPAGLLGPEGLLALGDDWAAVDLSSQNPAAAADLLCACLSPSCARAGPGPAGRLRARALAVRADGYFLPALLRNPWAGPALRHGLGLPPDGEGAAGLLGRFLIRPKARAARAARELWQAAAAAGRLTVGLQLRTASMGRHDAHCMQRDGLEHLAWRDWIAAASRSLPPPVPSALAVPCWLE